MKLKDWKEENRYTVVDIAKMSGIHESKIKRMLLEGFCHTLQDAHRIVMMTNGDVGFEDMILRGDC